MNPLPKICIALSCWFLASSMSFGENLSLSAVPDHPNGVYREGEPIHWQIKVSSKGEPAPSSLTYVIKKGGLTSIAQGKVALENGVGDLSASLPEPGNLLVELKSENGALKGAVGAVVAPEKLQVGAGCPADFDAFWKAKVDELEKIPANPVEVAAPSGNPAVTYAKITLDNIRGTHVQGQLARPATAEKFPALLQVQWAGVYPLQKSWVTEKAGKGWLALNILAHDLPIDEPEQFYKDLTVGALKNYTSIGNEDRETSYFLRMFLGCRRAVEYLASRPDWDGKTLVVIGTSQGGIQSFVTAALFPKVTAVIVEVPAGCDPSATAAGRAFGWPYWAASHSPKAMETSRYYDAVYFAARVKCPLLVGVGLADVTSPPGCVYAAYNSAQGPKEIVPMPAADHKTGHAEFYKRREEWLKALVSGKPAPVPQG
jgi:cephalosporin-C deacetylase